MPIYDVIVIGGGFYGLRIAQFLYDELGYHKILVLEKEGNVIQRASYNNQARVHNGYHYPRSVLTALRSRVNFPVFSSEYKEAIVSDFVKYYAVAKMFSKVNAKQFRRFFERIDAEIITDKEARKFFNPKLVDDVFRVKEYAFDAVKLRKLLTEEITMRPGIELKVNEIAFKVFKDGPKLQVLTDKGDYSATRVLNVAYSSVNRINKESGLPVIPLKHELTEMCLIELPEVLQNNAYTLMCGPFFSIMPFPPLGNYTLSHVRYTPHSEWHDIGDYVKDGHTYLKDIEKVSHFPQMWADVKRYMPDADKIKYTGKSLWEIKTVLPQSETDDSRPILFRRDHGGLKNYVCIIGGKIDNIYDVLKELKLAYGQ